MRHPVRLNSMPKRTICTQWQGWMAFVIRNKNALKDEKHLATVHYPKGIGNNYKDLPPLNCISHLFTAERIKTAVKQLNQEACPGIDSISIGDYKRIIDPDELAHRVRSGFHWPKPNLWIQIPKGDGSNNTRTLGIPCVEDRVIQQTWLLIMEDAVERMFLDCSYGYRPERNCHQAITEISAEIASRGKLWVVDADISAFFNTVPHGQLMSGQTHDHFVVSAISAFSRESKQCG